MPEFFFARLPILAQPLFNRELPGGEAVRSGGEVNVFNLMFIVGFALLISVLARHLSRRGRPK